jgi:hypothetical protein
MAWVVVAGAAIVGTAGLIGTAIQVDASKKAAETAATGATTAATTQANAIGEGIDETKRQFDAMQKLLDPYVQAGNKSLSAQNDLAGLNGPDAQRAAMETISNGPEMIGLTQQGENAMLQSGAATGGLRGGNMQGALAQFRPQMLSSLINQQYGRLSGITQMGQASAAGVGAAGMQQGANVANLLGQQGAATAGGQLGSANIYAGQQMAAGNAWGQVPNYFAQGAGLGFGLAYPKGTA